MAKKHNSATVIKDKGTPYTAQLGLDWRGVRVDYNDDRTEYRIRETIVIDGTCERVIPKPIVNKRMGR